MVPDPHPLPGLIAGQLAALLDAEIVAVVLVTVIAPIVFQAPAWHVRRDAWERITRGTRHRGFGRAFVIGGALNFVGASAGLYWIAAGDILCVVAIVLSAWVLMVENLR